MEQEDTMSGTLDAALKTLRWEREWIESEADAAQIKAAIRILEAAGKMNPEWWLMMAGQLSGINFSNQHPEVALVWLKQTFRALLDALPDEVKP
jgi:hypothetical protein